MIVSLHSLCQQSMAIPGNLDRRPTSLADAARRTSLTIIRKHGYLHPRGNGAVSDMTQVTRP
jgi:hypothetical protein